MGVITSSLSTLASSSLESTTRTTVDTEKQPQDSSASPRRRSWLATLARFSIIEFLRRSIAVGYLEIHDDGELLTFGRRVPGCNIVRLVIAADSFWQRVFYSGELGFSEAFMMGEVHVLEDDLTSVMNLWLENEDTMSHIASPVHKVVSKVSGWMNAYFGQTLGRARLNAMASYDQSNDLFKAFLSDEMMYSCALWSSKEGGPAGDIDSVIQPDLMTSSPNSSTGTLVTMPSDDLRLGELEAAQQRKIAHVLEALRLHPGSRVLEFGTGWGALAIAAARVYGAEVDTLTLSVEQKALAEERIRAAGLQDRIRVHLMDYRHTPRDWDGSFDAFVSIEMIEHVGPNHYQHYFSIVDRALKPSCATAVVTGSTFPESRYTIQQTEDFMRRYMWPNSALPSATALATAACLVSRGRLSLEGVENHGGHYARTLREWGRRLEARLTPAALGLSSMPISGATSEATTAVSSPVDAKYPSIATGLSCLGSRLKSVQSESTITTAQRAGTLLQVLPAKACTDDEAATFAALKRKWQYLFAYAGAGFAKGYITCHMLTFVRPGTPRN